MSKKMMKRSLALGALMAFVITGSAMAADGSMLLKTDSSKYTGNEIVASDNGASNPLLEGENRSYGLGVVGGTHIIENDLKVTNTLEGPSRNYGIAIENASNLSILGDTTLNVSNSADIRAVRINKTVVDGNFIPKIEFNNLTITASGNGTVIGIDSWYGGKAKVNGNTSIVVTSNGGGNITAAGINAGDNSEITFEGNTTSISAVNNGGGIAQAVGQAPGANGTKVLFKSAESTTITSKSNSSAIGIVNIKEAIFEYGDVRIDVTNTGTGTNVRDATGVKSNIEVKNTVNSFNVTVTGSGTDDGVVNNGVSTNADGTAGLNALGKTMSIAAQSFNVTVNASESNTISNRSDTHGIIAYHNGTIEITSKNINVTVNDSIGEAYGVLAGWRESDTTHVKGGKGAITLGGGESNVTVNVTGNDVTGLMSRGQTDDDKEGSSLVVNGNSLNVTAKSTGTAAYGLYVSNGTEDSQYTSNLTINSKETNITATGGETNIAIANYGQGVAKINGDVTITSEDVAIETRGNAKTLINTDEEGNSLGNKVVIIGDIAYNKQTNTDNENIDAIVNISLNGQESKFDGAIVATKKDGTADEALQDKVTTGTTLGLSNGATWNVAKDSFVNTLTGTDGNVVLKYEGVAEDGAVDVAKVAVGENNNTNLTVSGDDELTAEIEAGNVTADTALSALDAAVATTASDGTSSSVAKTVKTAEGKILGSYVLNEDGTADLQESSKSAAISEAGMNLKAHWRAHMNDMNKRMGDLRMANGETGVWTRMVRGESEYQGAKMQYNQYQLGYDEKLSVDKRWTVGAAVTFAEGDSSYGQGSSEDKSTAFAIYGTKLNNDGTFVDLIARYARLESDIEDSVYSKGEYDTNGMSVSAEFGKRIQQGNGLWIEPQVELIYGTVDSASVKFADGSVANYGDMDSLIGRVGFSIGKDIKQGNVYARASYLYDFDGETETTFTNGVVSGKPVEDDFGGGWWEVGVGANINLSKVTYIYADVEKTFGGEVDTNWQWNLGVRYSF